MNREEKVISNRQSRVSREGKSKEEEVKDFLLKDEEINNVFIIGKPSKVLKNKEPLYISYGEEKAMIDADLCVVRKKDNKLVCVISIKKSFRERGGQTAYWSKKIKEQNKNYKYILATPDVDNELFTPKELENPNTKKKKWRIILPYECDGVFIYSYKGKVYKENKFFVGDEYLKEFIKNLQTEKEIKN